MDNRPALIGIMVTDISASERMNAVLHEYRDYIIGRMGVPHRKMGIYLASVAVDAPQDVISAMSGKLGAIEGITAKTIVHRLPNRGASL